MMFKPFNFKNHSLFLILISTLFVLSCKTTKTATKTNSDNALLWKIEHKSNPNPSYLFGTIHLIDSENYFLPEGTLTAIDQCDKMVFEIDMKEMEDMGNIMGMMGKLMMKDGKSIKDLVSEDDYKIVTKHFEKMGMPLFLFEKMKPFFLTIFAQEGMDPQGLQSGTMKSYEMEFSELAKEKGMETGGLETIEFQMSLFDEISYEDQAKMLVDAIKSSGKEDDTMSRMITLYKAQNINALATMIEEESEDVNSFNKKLLVDRNTSWIQPIAEMISKEKVFIAVGAGHLGGPNGVIKLLREKGVKVTPVLR